MGRIKKSFENVQNKTSLQPAILGTAVKDTKRNTDIGKVSKPTEYDE